ncbi:MAG: PASTA domain-containing protein, partial [Vicinamibacteria bacterium]
IILLVYEGGTLLYNIWSAGVPTSSSTSPAHLPAANSRPLPNIYHLIFDAYQTDLLEHTLTDEAKKALGGFTYFPNNKAEWSQTFMSLSAIFAGRRYAYDRTINNFMSRAFDSEICVLYWLKSQQYQTLAYVTNNWDSRVRYLDRVVYHGAAARDELLPLNEESFWNVWLYSNTPPALKKAAMRSKWFGHLTEKDLEKLQEGRLLPATAPVTSYLGFKSLMATEKDLSPSGRYTVAHVIIPHYPLRLRADCSYNLGSSETHILEQSQCALKLIQEFVRLLKDLGRFDDSLIIIHGDHGDTYRTKNGELTENARARSLDAVLLVKPVGKTGEGELEVLETRTSLADIPTIIMNSVADAGTPGPHLPPWTPQRSFVPFVKGEQIDSAELILNRQGFVLGEVTHATSKLPTGSVLSQHPPAYQEGDGIEEVSLVVSSGPPEGPDVMPDFVGRDVSEVSEWLARKHLPASSIHHVPHAVAPMGMVVAQSPQPGHKADGSEEIRIYVSSNNR